MKTNFIRAQLETVLHNYATANSIPAAYQNRSFKPHGDLWLRATLIPANTVGASACANDYKGLFQVDLFSKESIGAKDAEDKAAEIAAAFERGSNFNGVYIPQPPSVGVGRNDSGWYHTPIRITYQLID